MTDIDSKNYVFTFGGHKDETYDEVFECDPGYLLWCHDNVAWFELSATDIGEAEDRVNELDRDNRAEGRDAQEYL